MAMDFPASPAEGATFASPIGLNYVFTSGVWRLADPSPLAPINSPVFTGNPQAPTPSPGDNDTSIATTAFVTGALSGGASGVYKASELVGTTGAVTQVDIPLPDGYRELELNLYDVWCAITTTTLVCRFSFDNGATYTATNYAWGLDYINNAATGGWSMNGSTNFAATYIQLIMANMPSDLSNSASVKIHMQRTSMGLVYPGMFWEGRSQSGAAYLHVRGHGRWVGGASKPTHIRILPGSGNFTMAGGWQLNGIK